MRDFILMILGILGILTMLCIPVGLIAIIWIGIIGFKISGTGFFVSILIWGIYGVLNEKWGKDYLPE